MKNKKMKNIIIGFLIIIVILLLIIIALLVKPEINNNSVLKDEEVIENNNENLDNNKVIYDENDFIRQTKIILVDAPKCYGGNDADSIITEIIDGNIIISQGREKLVYEIGNVKYIYNISVIACDNVILYYITDNNELYFAKISTIISSDLVFKKVDNYDVVEFLGTELKQNDSSYTNYLKVLLENGEVGYIDYIKVLG